MASRRIPYHVSGEVGDWHNLAHRTVSDLEAAGITLRQDTVARCIDPHEHRVMVSTAGGGEDLLRYDALVIATGAGPGQAADRGLRPTRAQPRRAPAAGLAATQVEPVIGFDEL